MNSEDAIVEIVRVTSLTEADVRGFLACSDAERAALVQAYKDAGVVASVSAWGEVVSILKLTGEFVGLVLPLMGAVQAVFGVAAVL